MLVEIQGEGFASPVTLRLDYFEWNPQEEVLKCATYMKAVAFDIGQTYAFGEL